MVKMHTLSWSGELQTVIYLFSCYYRCCVPRVVIIVTVILIIIVMMVTYFCFFCFLENPVVYMGRALMNESVQ
jgi:hypothetical protein